MYLSGPSPTRDDSNSWSMTSNLIISLIHNTVTITSIGMRLKKLPTQLDFTLQEALS